MVESLISQGSGVNAKDEQGITPLMQVDLLHVEDDVGDNLDRGVNVRKWMMMSMMIKM